MQKYILVSNNEWHNALSVILKFPPILLEEVYVGREERGLNIDK